MFNKHTASLLNHSNRVRHTASAELDGFSVEIAVRSVIKDHPSPETLLPPGPTADAKGAEAHSKQSAAFQGMFLQPPAIQFTGYW